MCDIKAINVHKANYFHAWFLCYRSNNQVAGNSFGFLYLWLCVWISNEVLNNILLKLQWNILYKNEWTLHDIFLLDNSLLWDDNILKTRLITMRSKPDYVEFVLL